MRGLMIVGEYIAAFLLLLVEIPLLILGLLVSIIEVPRYLKMKSK